MDKKNALSAVSAAAAGFAAGRLIDFALMGGLFFTAAGAVGFAGYETMLGDHSPQINGMQYLALFAQPSRHPVGPQGGEKGGLDMTPVGAVATPAPSEVVGYALVGAQTQFAWVREGNHIFAVKPGDEVARLGRIAAIAPRDGRWALIGDKGQTLIVGAPTEIAAPEGGRFDKRMIFRNP